MFGRRAFSVLTYCFCSRPGGLQLVAPHYLRDPSRSDDSFRRDVKTFLFLFYKRTQSSGYAIMR